MLDAYRLAHFKRLMAQYYKLLGQDHHKDRDCHFSLGVRFSYDGQVKYYIEHWGYVYDEIHEDFDSYEMALREFEYHLGRAVDNLDA
jgi:hypothetical protein